ncbi:MAG: hypothetical protein H0X29_07335 [Parachlamydiaceae bacterium]|nr:hypothetical protein [Parachlamydiaceae bacterium]
MTTTTNATLSQRADKLSNLHRTMKRKSIGSQLQILKHLLKAMEISTTAMSLKQKGSAPLFLGLSVATIGIFKSESALGIIGPALEKIIRALGEGMKVIMPNVSMGGQQFLSMLCLASYTFIACLASQTASQGVGPLPKSLEGVDLKWARFFSFELCLKLMNSSSALKEAFTVFIDACGGDKIAQRVGASILAQIGQLLIILAGSRESNKPANYLVSDEGIYLKQGVRSAAEAVLKSESEGIVNSALAVAVNQLRIALDDNNETAFMEALNDLLESQDTSMEELLKDLQELQRTASMIVHVTGHSHDEDSFTGIMNVI